MDVMIVNDEILPAGFTADGIRSVAPSVQHSQSISWARSFKTAIPPLATMTALIAMGSPALFAGHPQPAR